MREETFGELESEVPELSFKKKEINNEITCLINNNLIKTCLINNNLFNLKETVNKGSSKLWGSGLPYRFWSDEKIPTGDDNYIEIKDSHNIARQCSLIEGE
jgi:hypothetical protein